MEFKLVQVLQAVWPAFSGSPSGLIIPCYSRPVGPELATGPSFWGMSHWWEAETVHQTPVSWSSWSSKAAQQSSPFWAMEGIQRASNIVLDVTKENQQTGNVLTTKLWRRASNEGKLQSKTHTLKPSLTHITVILLKHTTSMRSRSNLPFESTWKPFSGSQLQWHLSREECITLCSLTGNQCPCNTNMAQEIQGEFIPGSHFASQAGVSHCLGESGFVKLSTFPVYSSLAEENIYLPALTVAKFYFFHNQL